MSSLTGQVNIFPFDIQTLRTIFCVEPNASATVEYLGGYLRDIGVCTILHEQVYMDRHYLDEFAEYYSRSFRRAEAPCQRALFFASTPDLTQAAYNQSFETASTSRDAARDTLQQAFLGFSVKRPLEATGVGRTVVATYPSEGRRRYTATRPYAVHLPSGVRLEVEGLAFQQQDMGAAVCASTALWSALQRVAHVSGHRSPTPVAVTKAADSPFPASDGLDLRQMATALSSLGYHAEFFPVAESRLFFRACVAACLDSRLPVVLMLTRQLRTGAGSVEIGHAVTVSGYSLDAPSAEVPAPSEQGLPLKTRGAAISVVYVHDDNLGPHAHYELFDSDERNLAGHPRLMLRRGRKGEKLDYWEVDEWAVEGALVPKPAELRMAMSSLLHMMWRCRAVVVKVGPALDPEYQSRVTTGIEYKRSIIEAGFGTGARDSMERLSLPRHVGVVAAWLGDVRYFEFVLDVSETDRLGLPLLAVASYEVAPTSALGRQLRAIAEIMECPFIVRGLA